MNPDAGTEDFFWREMNEEEEEAAKKAIFEQVIEDQRLFLDEIRKREQKRQRKGKW